MSNPQAPSRRPPKRPSPPPPTTQLSTPPDAVYRSLLALLASPNTSSAASHLQLLPPNSLYASISHYLSTLPPADVDGFVRQLVGSPPLWFTLEQQAGASSLQASPSAAVRLEGTNPASPTPLPSLLDRSKALSQAVAHGVLNYIKLLLVDRSGDTGWRTRRSLAQWVRNVMLVAQRSYYEGVEAEIAASAAAKGAAPTETKIQLGAPPITSLPYLTILSGLLLGLAAHEAQRKEAKGKRGMLAHGGLSARKIKGEVEDELCTFMAELLGEDPSPSTASEKEAVTELVKTVQAADKAAPPVEAKPESVKQSAGQQQEHVESVTAPSDSDWEKEFSARQAAFDSAIPSSSGSSKASASVKRTAIPPSLLPGQGGAVPLLVLLSTVSPHISDEKLAVLPPLRTLDLLSSLAVPGIFDSSAALDIFSVLAWAQPTQQGVNALDTVQNQALFTSLGPLARVASIAAGKAVETGRADALVEPKGLLELMGATARKWGEAWERSGPVVKAEGEDAKTLRTRFWTIAKTLLFGYVMIFDGVMEGVIDMCPSPTLTLPAPAQPSTSSSSSDPSSSALPTSIRTSDGAKLVLTRSGEQTTSNIPASYIASISSLLSSFSHLAFITSTFGSDAFEAYNRVLFGALEVLGRDRLACEAVLRELGKLARESTSPELERRIYHLDVAEQIVGFVSDEIVAQEVLEACKPYLESTSNKRAFESAHSVVLSILTSHPPLVPSLTPYYSSLILELFPRELTDGQLEHALTTLVSASSDIDDALAWLVIERLSEEIERTRFIALGIEGEASSSSSASIFPTAPTEVSKPSSPGAASGLVDKPPLQPAMVHRQLQKALISLLPSLNLVLLRSVLSRATRYILSHPEGSFERRELCEKAFEALEGLNAATREEGLRWWLDNRKTFGV